MDAAAAPVKIYSHLWRPNRRILRQAFVKIRTGNGFSPSKAGKTSRAVLAAFFVFDVLQWRQN